MFFDRQELCKGVHLNILQTDKFKRNFASVSFVMPHKREYAALSSVLADVLTRATGKYPELKLIERELDDCYGAQLSSYSSVKGESKIVSFSMESLQDCYSFDGESIFERSFDLLYDVIFDPYLVEGCFFDQYVESEKEKLLMSVGRRKNSKRSYALDSLKKNMCEGETYGVFSYGSEEDILAIYEKKLYDFYKYMLSDAGIELFYVGGEAKEKVIGLFSRMFAGKPRSRGALQRVPDRITVKKVKHISEPADYKQSVLTMGFRINIPYDSEQKYAFSLFNSIFGSGVNSKLFKVVREQMHLCYYASCTPDLAKGVAFVSSGIDPSNEEIARNAIMEQLGATQRGEFSDEDIDDCKRALGNAYKELYDSPDGLCGWYLGHVIFGNYESADSVYEKISRVTREEIIQAALSMELDTVFVLSGTAKSNCAEDMQDE